MGKLRSFFRRGGLSKLRRPSSSSASSSAPTHGGDELERIFRKFDTNGDNRISSSELAAIITSLGRPATDEEVALMMAEADADGDGFISLEEFIVLNTPAAHEGKEEVAATVEEDLRSAFDVFDLDHNGVISVEELARVLRGIGEAATEAQCYQMIKGVDRDGDGFVNFEEFRAMMTMSDGASTALAIVARAANQ